MTDYRFSSAISRHIWDSKYRYRDGNEVRDQDITDTWRRIARALSFRESDPHAWEKSFYDILQDFTFLPGGRIQAGSGIDRRVTLINCFVMGPIEDSMDGIFDALKEGALTMQQGGGVGYDFSTLRPSGTPAQQAGTIASGPVPFMDIWDSMCATLLSTGARRGAMMATLRCDHPDIEAFIDAKRDKSRLRHFNLSILVSDDFMRAVEADTDWPLVFPDDALPAGTVPSDMVLLRWSGRPTPIPCRVVRRVSARQLWTRIMRANYEYAEPGVLFIDRINHFNNLYWREQISATNPCGEIPLPPYGACDLGSVNLTRFVQQPFSQQARLDFDAIRRTVEVATRMMDNVIDISRFPLPKQAEQAQGSRRIGLGITGLADCLIMLGESYGSASSLALSSEIMRTVCYTAYRVSTALAREKGPFPFFNQDSYLEAHFIQSLPEDIRTGIAEYGIRNSHLTAIAPTGTISLLANNISSGLEPVFDLSYRRRMLGRDGSWDEYPLTDFAYYCWQQIGGRGKTLPPAFVTAQTLPPETHLDMQAAIQPFVDNAISKTINVPEDYDFDTFQNLYRLAYDKGLKGCTTFRPNAITGDLLSSEGAKSYHCCTIEREAD